MIVLILATGDIEPSPYKYSKNILQTIHKENFWYIQIVIVCRTLKILYTTILTGFYTLDFPANRCIFKKIKYELVNSDKKTTRNTPNKQNIQCKENVTIFTYFLCFLRCLQYSYV